jgi:hypothetical protein
MDQEQLSSKIAEEERIRDKVEEDGSRWIKVYFGGGAHFENWLSQAIELKGDDGVRVEEIAAAGFRCCEDSNEKLYRIWVRDSASDKSGNSGEVS